MNLPAFFSGSFTDFAVWGGNVLYAGSVLYAVLYCLQIFENVWFLQVLTFAFRIICSVNIECFLS